MDFEYIVCKEEMPQVTLAGNAYGYRLKSLLWTVLMAKDFLAEAGTSLRVQYLKLSFPLSRPRLKEIKETNTLLDKSLNILKRYYRKRHGERIEFAWVRVPLSGQYHVALFYHDTQLDCSADKAGALNAILLDNLYGHDYSVTYLCDPIVTDHDSYLITSLAESGNETVKFLNSMLAYVSPYTCCSWEKGKGESIYRLEYDAELPKFCGFSSKQKIAMREKYANLSIWDY